MTNSLYSLDVLRMAASVANFPPLADADETEERRSPTCGSRMTVTLKLDANNRVAEMGLDAKACALGQAAAAIVARGAIGQDLISLQSASESWRAYLAGEGDALPDWPDLALLAAGRDYPARHPSMRLAFEAASVAMARALAQKTS